MVKQHDLMTYGCIGIFALLACCCVVTNTSAEEGGDTKSLPMPIPVEEEERLVWNEPKSIDESPRYWRRPGTIGALHAVTDMYVALYELRPRLTNVAFPAILRHHKVEEGDHEASLEAREQARNRLRNKRRQFVYDVNSLQVQLFEDIDREAMEKDLTDTSVQEFEDCVEWHGKRGAIVKLMISARSLQSDKIEGGIRCSYFYVVKKDEGWKVVWWAEE